MKPSKASTRDSDSSEHVVFLGIYNANPFRRKIQDWLPKLDLSSTELVIADNASTDGSEKWLRELSQSLSVNAHFLQNDKNYGGYGNLMNNLKYFPSARWVTTLHQDDFYRDNHVQNHRKVIEKSLDNLGMVCSESKSVDINGHEIPYPRAIWLLERGLDPVTIFIAHLKQHIFPFSGATFATEVLRRYYVPWHSTSFPDTELVMKMIAEFSVRFADGVTVDYLENPVSESHHLSNQQREFGAYVALSRVFAHPNFRKVCQLVPIAKRKFFYKSLNDGLRTRFTDTKLRELISQTMLEIVAEHIGMDSDLADLLVRGYQNVADYRAVAHLRTFSNNEFEPQKLLPTTSDGELPSNNQEPRYVFAFYFFRRIPRKLRIKLFRILMMTKYGKQKFPDWDFIWDKE